MEDSKNTEKENIPLVENPNENDEITIENIQQSTNLTVPAIVEKKKPKPGILRLDISKPRRSSGGSVEFRSQPELLGEVSPSYSGTTPPPQLSVTWASQCDENEAGINNESVGNLNASSSTTTTTTTPNPNIINRQMPSSHVRSPPQRGGSKSRKHGIEEKANELSTDMTSPLSEENNSEDEDYSVSVSAIMQKRASVRGHHHRKKGYKGGRRPSSPMDNILMDAIGIGGGGGGGRITDRRRSSVYTTSSGDTAISVEDGTNQDSIQEQTYENIRLHKEVIQSVKHQPWSMRRKLRLVRQAKTYIARHEGALQERFAMSRSTRDLWARFKIVMAARWMHFKRELASFLIVLIPWELRIKQIESHFGSGVASYFTFLRWLLWVNIMISIPLCAFVIFPEFFATDYYVADDRKIMTPQEMKTAGNVLTIWEFEGYLKYSPLFYGYYTDQKDSGAIKWGYNLPLAYFLTSVTVYIYSFVAILNKMADNSRTSKLSSKDEECVFTWKLFTGWDFMIGHAETASNRVASVVVGFKEALLEEAEKKRDKRNWKILLLRIMINIVVMVLLAASGYTVVAAVDRSETAGPNANWLRRNEVNVIMTLLSFFLPMIFEALGLFEKWHPRKQLRFQLARIMILNLLNLYSLMFSFIYKISSKDKNLQSLKILHGNITNEKEHFEQMLNKTRQMITTTISSIFIENSSTLDGMENDTDIMTSSSTIAAAAAAYASESLSSIFEVETRTQCFAIPVTCSKSPSLLTTTTSSSLSSSAVPLPTITSKIGTTTSFGLTTSLVLLNLTTSMFPTNPTTNTNLPPTTTTPTTTEPTTTFVYEYGGNDTYFQYFDYFDNIDGNDFPDRDAALKNSNSKSRNQKLLRNPRQIQFPQTDYDDYTTNPVDFDAVERKNDVEVIFERMSNKYGDVSITNTRIPITTTKATTERSINSTTTPTITSTTPTTITTSTNIPITTSTITTTTTTLSMNSTENIVGTTEEIQTTEEKFSEVTTLPTGAIEYPYMGNGTPIYNISAINSGDIVFVSGGPYEYNEESNCTKVICVVYKERLIPTSTTPSSTASTRTPQDDIIYYENSLKNVSKILAEIRTNLTSMCWETSLGQELSKVIVFDAVMSIAASFCIDYLRALFVRYMNDYWCWDMEKTFPQYGDFKIAESILNLVYNQGQVWMGIFFSPGLVIVNLIKLLIFMYLRSWIVMTCNVPHEVVFKASKSNNFYLALLLTMLFLCVLPVSFSIVWLRPSWHCGPFTHYNRVSEFFTTTIKKAFKDNETWYKPLEYLTSASTVIPLMLLLILIIYYLISLTGALREANQDLKVQLQKERMEERRKMLKVPEKKPAEESEAGGITARWKMILEAASSSPITPTGPPANTIVPEVDGNKNQTRKDLLARLMKKALRKASITSEDDSILPRYTNDDDTDTDHHDSLPHDEEFPRKRQMKSERKQTNGTARRIPSGRKPSIMDIVQIAKAKEKANEPHPKGKFKINRDIVQKDDIDPEANSRIISERRRSFLKRQSKVSEPSDSQAEDDDDDDDDQENINYKVINEKNKQVEKKTRKEPKVFTFDEKSINNKPLLRHSDERRHSEKLEKTEKLSETSKITPIKKKKSTSDIFHRQPQHESPQDESSPPSPANEVMATLNKGRKKIGSFLALVKEAVKKTEEHHHVGKPDYPSPTASAFEVESPNVDDVSTEQEDGDSRKGTMRIKKKPSPTRQDSQASIWSDKLPTIKISKSEGDECILENNEKDNNNSKDGGGNNTKKIKKKDDKS